MALLIDQRLDELHHALLACCGRVQLASHFGETPINVLEAPIDVMTQIDEVLMLLSSSRLTGASLC